MHVGQRRPGSRGRRQASSRLAPVDRRTCCLGTCDSSTPTTTDRTARQLVGWGSSLGPSSSATPRGLSTAPAALQLACRTRRPSAAGHLRSPPLPLIHRPRLTPDDGHRTGRRRTRHLSGSLSCDTPFLPAPAIGPSAQAARLGAHALVVGLPHARFAAVRRRLHSLRRRRAGLQGSGRDA